MICVVCQGFAFDEYIYLNLLGWSALIGGAATRWGEVVFADVCFFIRVRSAKFYVSTGLFERVTTCLRMFVEEIVQ
jgi:hypothetical protein